MCTESLLYLRMHLCVFCVCAVFFLVFVDCLMFCPQCATCAVLLVLVYIILPPTTGLVDYVTPYVSKNFFRCCWWSNGGVFVTVNSNSVGCFFYNRPHCLHTQIKPKSFELRWNSFFLPGAEALHVYMRARMLCCFSSLFSTKTLQRVLTVSVESCAQN